VISTTARLLTLIAEGRLDPRRFATHRYPLSSTMTACDTFAAAAGTDA
jgi:threonine dehydrogenase-like Zn-dependent dehydrogenase